MIQIRRLRPNILGSKYEKDPPLHHRSTRKPPIPTERGQKPYLLSFQETTPLRATQPWSIRQLRELARGAGTICAIATRECHAHPSRLRITPHASRQALFQPSPIRAPPPAETKPHCWKIAPENQTPVSCCIVVEVEIAAVEGANGDGAITSPSGKVEVALPLSDLAPPEEET